MKVSSTEKRNHEDEKFGNFFSKIINLIFFLEKAISHFEMGLIWNLAMQQSDPDTDVNVQTMLSY